MNEPEARKINKRNGLSKYPMWPTERVNTNNYLDALCNLYNASSPVSNNMVVPAECAHCICQQVLRPQVQVQIQVLQICTRVLLEYKYKYQVLHLWNLGLLSYTVSKLWMTIGQVFVSESGFSHFNALTGVIPCQYRHKWYIAKN